MTSINCSTTSDAQASSFKRIPILSLAEAKDLATKPAFLRDLRDALLHVGFLYLSDTGVPEPLTVRVCEQARLFFDESVLPLEEKEEIEMKNQKSFLGWSRVSAYFSFLDSLLSRDFQFMSLRSTWILKIEF
jgi:isopenicillin N synthase-like dioxygenase